MPAGAEHLEQPTEHLEQPTEHLEQLAEHLEQPTEHLEQPTEQLEQPTIEADERDAVQWLPDLKGLVRSIAKHGTPERPDIGWGRCRCRQPQNESLLFFIPQ